MIPKVVASEMGGAQTVFTGLQDILIELQNYIIAEKVGML